MTIPKLDFRNNRNSGIIVFLFTIAIIFAILRGSEQVTVLAVIALMLGYALYTGVSSQTSATSQPKSANSKTVLDLDSAVRSRVEKNDRAATPSSIYAIKAFPKTGLKYLRDNEDMFAIANNLLYLRVYDNARYQDMLLLMDRMLKVYVYTLVGRYACQHGHTLFVDMREMLRQKLYSFYVVLPMKTKHMYGLDPHGELARSIKVFTATTRRMIRVIENYARRECKAPYIDHTSPMSYDPSAPDHMIP